MTSTMRSSFEICHGCIFLDAMSRKTNFHLRPYISIIISNELGEAQTVIERFFTPKLDQAYIFIIKSALEMAPNINPKNIRVIFADQFFNQDLIIACGLIFARLCYDYYHL